MQKKGCLIAVFAVVVLGIISIVLFYIVIGNTIVGYEENVNKCWGDVQTAYKRRADLIPNLESTVKGYAEHESSTLQEVVEARAKATSVNINPEKLDAASLRQFEEAQSNLGSALNSTLSRLMVVAERYPDLKANLNFSDFQAQLEGTENRIAVERRNFNEAVKIYNSYIRKFPASFVANNRGFERKVYFEAEAGSEKAPEVKFIKD